MFSKKVAKLVVVVAVCFGFCSGLPALTLAQDYYEAHVDVSPETLILKTKGVGDEVLAEIWNWIPGPATITDYEVGFYINGAWVTDAYVVGPKTLFPLIWAGFDRQTIMDYCIENNQRMLYVDIIGWLEITDGTGVRLEYFKGSDFIRAYDPGQNQGRPALP